MRRGLLFCGGIILGWVAESILTSGPDLFADGKRWFSADYERFISLSLILQGAVAALGAALWLGRALIPLASVPAWSGTTVSGPKSATIGGGHVLPICGILFLYAAIVLFVGARVSAEQLEVMDSMSSQSGSGLVNYYCSRERTGWTFGVLWLIVGGMLLGTPLFMKPWVWKMGWPINRAGGGVAIGGLLLSGMALFVWRVNGTFLRGAYEFFSLIGLLGVLAGTSVTVFGSVMAVARADCTTFFRSTPACGATLSRPRHGEQR